MSLLKALLFWEVKDALDQWQYADICNSANVFVAGDDVHNLGYHFYTNTTRYSPSHTPTIHEANVANNNGQISGHSSLNSLHSDIRMSTENRKAAEIRRLEQELEDIELQKRETALKRRLDDLRGANGSPEEAHANSPATSGNLDPIERIFGKASHGGHDLEVGDFEGVFPVGAITTQVRVRLTMS
jgi:hypothetical protein